MICLYVVTVPLSKSLHLGLAMFRYSSLAIAIIGSIFVSYIRSTVSIVFGPSLMLRTTTPFHLFGKKKRYNINNAAILGCLYLAPGLGNLIGSRLAGIQADKVVRTWLTKRGYRRPEDRLRACLFGSWLLMPATLIAAGWLIKTG